MRSWRPFCSRRVALGGGANLHAAGVVGVGGNGDQAAAGQASDDAAHGWRLDLLGGGQFAQCFRASEHQHRKRGEPRGAFAGGDILLAHTAQQVDGGGVQAVGDGTVVLDAGDE